MSLLHGVNIPATRKVAVVLQNRSLWRTGVVKKHFLRHNHGHRSFCAHNRQKIISTFTGRTELQEVPLFTMRCKNLIAMAKLWKVHCCMHRHLPTMRPIYSGMFQRQKSIHREYPCNFTQKIFNHTQMLYQIFDQNKNARWSEHAWSRNRTRPKPVLYCRS